MPYLTFDYLNNRSYDLRKSFSSVATQVFLSHIHNDYGIVKKVIGFLREFNVSVYVDYLDHELPDNTSKETAERIRYKINDCDKPTLLATPNISESKWIPWELGVCDRKGLNNVAILPLVHYDNNWAEREYYKIYGRIEKSSLGNWCFFSPNSEYGTKLQN